jgi:hypothetical protein
MPPEQINIQAIATPRVKIGRPKKNKSIEYEKTAERQSAIEHTDKKVDVDVVVESVESVDTFIRNVHWGDYDVAFLVETLVKLSSAITGIDLFPYQQALQRRVFWSILLNDGATITGLISRQGGKSQTIACTITTLCVVMPSLANLFPEQLGVYKHGFWVGIYAPVAEQADTLYDKVRATAKSTHAQEIYKDPGIDTKMELHGCKWTNGSFVHRQTASPKAKTESKTWHLLVLEESQDLVEEVIDQKLMPMVAWTNGTTVMIGTVVENKCPFYYQIERNKEDDVDKQDHLRTHIAFDYEDVIKYNSRYAKHVQSAIRKFGKESKYFKMSYGLQWQFGVTQPITYESIIKYTYAPKTSIVKYSDEGVIVSIDLAKEVDLTITTVSKISRVYMEYEDGVYEYAQAIQILNWLATGNMKYTQQRPIIKDFLAAYPNVIALVVDTTGVGSAVYEEMQREWPYMCEWYPYVFNPKSKQALTQLFEEYYYSNRLIIPSDEEAKKNEHQKLLLRQSTTMKKVSLQNCTYFTSQTEHTADDYFWSWLLGIYGGHQIISKGMNVESTPSNNYRPSFQVTHKSLEDRRQQVRNGEHLKLSMRDQRLQKWGF